MRSANQLLQKYFRLLDVFDLLRPRNLSLNIHDSPVTDLFKSPNQTRKVRLPLADGDLFAQVLRVVWKHGVLGVHRLQVVAIDVIGVLLWPLECPSGYSGGSLRIKIASTWANLSTSQDDHTLKKIFRW